MANGGGVCVPHVHRSAASYTDYIIMNESQSQPVRSRLPESARINLINEMTKNVADWFQTRAEEVLENPADFDTDVNGLRWEICGAVAEDLHHHNGEAIEQLIEEAYQKAGLLTSVPDQNVRDDVVEKSHIVCPLYEVCEDSVNVTDDYDDRTG